MPEAGARVATVKAGVDGSVDWTVLTAVYMRRAGPYAKAPRTKAASKLMT